MLNNAEVLEFTKLVNMYFHKVELVDGPKLIPLHIETG